MILIMTGTHEQCFGRLVLAAESLADAVAPEEVLVQLGPCPMPTGREAWVDYMPGTSVHTAMREARVVITHGGPGTIREAHKVGKTPIVVPRDPRFGEHVDDHQLRYARHVARLGQAITCTPERLVGVVRSFVPSAPAAVPDVDENRRRLYSILEGLGRR